MRAGLCHLEHRVDHRIIHIAEPGERTDCLHIDPSIRGQHVVPDMHNDGDNNLRAGIVSNRIDLLSKLDISDAGFGIDVSADRFYDSVYNQRTQNGDATTYNPASQPADKFTSETEAAAGRDVELRNLFAYGTQTIGGVPVTLRVGRLVNIFGESLFFAANGIAYGTAPLDIERAEAVPDTQAKDLFLPVGQANISAQLTESISATAYYQPPWPAELSPAAPRPRHRSWVRMR